MRIIEYIRHHLLHICLLFVLGYAAIYATAFVRIYFMAHPYHTSSAWMLDNFEKGSRVVGPHWDDELPISVPGQKRSPDLFVVGGGEMKLPLYEPETRAKLDLTLRRISQSDYIVFPTPRMADSLPRIPEEFPQTNALLQLLWGEKLGFKLVKSFKNRPELLGITFNDDLADESFSVYDHPKVTVFQNIEKLSSEDLRKRIDDKEIYGTLPTMNEMLLMDEGGWVGKAPSWLTGKVAPLLFALFFIQVIALSFWALVGPALPFMRDRGFGLTPLLGLIFSAGLCWILAFAHIAPITTSTCYVVVALMVFAACVRLICNSKARAQLSEAWRNHGLLAELGFIGGVLVVWGVWVFDPQFFVLGQQIDGAYLQYFTRNEVVPPLDLINPAEIMNGFYFDRFVLGWFLKGVGVSGTFGLELCLLLIGGILGAALYSIVTTVCSKRALASSVSLVLLVPVVLMVLVVRESRQSGPVVQHELFNAEQARLMQWLSKRVVGAPIVIDACLPITSSGVPLAAGLPAFQRISGTVAPAVGSEEPLCSFRDPQSIFDAMMKYGANLFIVASADVASVGLDARPELFAKIYDRPGVQVFAPAFSDLFRNTPRL